MIQLRLVESPSASRVLDVQQIKATFRKISEYVQEVVLEINSQKFLINFKAGVQQLERFEVIAVKGFVDLGVKFMQVLKSIVSKLYFEV